MVKVQKVPLRMCVACREMKPKRELIRVVRTPEGLIEVDLTGKRSGRGAYLCRSELCLKKALKLRKLESALGCKLPETLVSEIERLVMPGVT